MVGSHKFVFPVGLTGFYVLCESFLFFFVTEWKWPNIHACCHFQFHRLTLLSVERVHVEATLLEGDPYLPTACSRAIPISRQFRRPLYHEFFFKNSGTPEVSTFTSWQSSKLDNGCPNHPQKPTNIRRNVRANVYDWITGGVSGMMGIQMIHTFIYFFLSY